jgi:hypothetical protein
MAGSCGEQAKPWSYAFFCIPPGIEALLQGNFVLERDDAGLHGSRHWRLALTTFGFSSFTHCIRRKTKNTSLVLFWSLLSYKWLLDEALCRCLKKWRRRLHQQEAFIH